MEIDKKTILLVEDEELIAIDRKLNLEKYNFKVVHASNGEQALELFNTEENISLVLMDIDLGCCPDGIMIAKNILSIKYLPIIFLSNKNESELILEIESINSFGYLSKTCDTKVLVSVMNTALKHFEYFTKVEEGESKLKVMIANIADVIAIVTPEGRVLYKSENIKESFGYEPMDFGVHLTDTKNAWDLIHPSDISIIQVLRNRLVQKDNISLKADLRLLCKNGSYKNIKLTATSLLNNPSIKGILLSFHDVTEKSKIENDITEAKLLFHSVIDSIPQNLYVKDREGRFIHANINYCKLQEKTLKEIIGMTDFDMHSKELAEKYLMDDQLVIESGVILELEESHEVNGTLETVHVIKSPLHDHRMRTVGTIGIFWKLDGIPKKIKRKPRKKL